MITCVQPFSIQVTNPLCDNTIDWINNPGNCRLRIKNYNPADWNAGGCAACPAGGAPNWDGTFPNYVPGPITSFQIPFTTGNVGGKAPLFGTNCAVGFFPGFGWYLALACNPVYIYSSAFNLVGPIGTYFRNQGCVLVASFDVEAYSL